MQTWWAESDSGSVGCLGDMSLFQNMKLGSSRPETAHFFLQKQERSDLKCFRFFSYSGGWWVWAGFGPIFQNSDPARRPEDVNEQEKVEQSCWPTQDSKDGENSSALSVHSNGNVFIYYCSLSKTGFQDWVSSLGLKIWTQDWISRCGANSGSQDWVAKLGAKTGSQERVSRVGLKSGCRDLVPKLGAKTGCQDWVPGLGTRTGCQDLVSWVGLMTGCWDWV